jgi:CRISPR/Cas system-associated exonuclease Cas4 (RecB family)
MKFKYKYIDKINWLKDELDEREYYENLKTGLDFHLLCERYFFGTEEGVQYLSEENKKRAENFLEKIKQEVPIKKEKIYKSEYSLYCKIDKSKIQAKFDLVVIGNDSIEIWDWKTELKQINRKNAENRMQTIVYLFICTEVIPKIYNLDIPYENISMNYFQPDFEDSRIRIEYSEEKHKKNREIIKTYINSIEKLDFMYKNTKHCKYCEFNKLCNSEKIYISGGGLCQLDLYLEEEE